MDTLFPIIIVIGAIISIINTAKKKNQQENEKSQQPQNNNRQAVNPDIAQFFGLKDTLSFFEQQFSEKKQKEVSFSEGDFPSITAGTSSLENQDIAFSTPLIRDEDSNTYETAKTGMSFQFESSSPVYAYDLAPHEVHDYEAPLKETARNAALINLFSNKNEITRAVIYSEILKPKFKKM